MEKSRRKTHRKTPTRGNDVCLLERQVIPEKSEAGLSGEITINKFLTVFQYLFKTFRRRRARETHKERERMSDMMKNRRNSITWEKNAKETTGSD